MLEESKAGWMVQIGFKSKTNSADYHDEMNTEHYMEWFTQLLSNLPPNSVIIVNNVTYHNKQRTKSKQQQTKKDDIKQRLNRQNIQYADTGINRHCWKVSNVQQLTCVEEVL